MLFGPEKSFGAMIKTATESITATESRILFVMIGVDTLRNPCA